MSACNQLAYYDFIPEYAPRTRSVTTGRPSDWNGGFQFQHLASHLFFGYQLVDLSEGQ